MPGNLKVWIDRPKGDAEMLYMTSDQLWQATRDGYERAQGMPDAKDPIRRTSRAWGYTLAADILRPFAAEYSLKGLSSRDVGRFKKTHNLLELFKALGRETRAEVAEQGTQQGVEVPEFLAEHSNVFSEWRS